MTERGFASPAHFAYDIPPTLKSGRSMAKLNLSVAVGPYDRTRALIDGTVQIDGVNPVCMTLSPEEIFFRALRHTEFDICELSLSSFTVKTAQGGGPYVGVPCFVSRAKSFVASRKTAKRRQEERERLRKLLGKPNRRRRSE